MALGTLVAAAALGGCREPSRPAGDATAQRLIEPRDTRSTATLPRAQIGGESRYVLAAHPATVLRSSETITLPNDAALLVPVALPDGLAGATVRLDATYSARDPQAAAADDLAKLREGKRITVAAAPVVVAGGRAPAAPDQPTLALSVPESLRGKEALLTVIARRLPATAIERIETEAMEVPTGARLVFGYGVEEPGWSTGWPPVRLRVSAGDTTLFDRRLDPVVDPRDRRWFDASVDLAAVAGKRTALVFEAEALPAAKATVDRSFVVVSNPRVLPRPEPRGKRNLILVSPDTLRARSVSAYGCPRPTTPTLDRRMAGAGALVKTAVTPFPFTPPSHMTMLTGLEPCAHGVHDLHSALAPARTTLAEAMRAAGYETAAFTEDAYLVAGNGFDRGFDVYRENRSEESASPGFAVETFGDASAWLTAHADRPFFLFVHTYQVHDPYTPPRGYADLFPDVNPNDKNDAARADYEREIRYTDDLFAGFLDTLDALGVAEQTLVVVTSDHGEGFGEHFWTGHAFDLHDEALLVPLLLRAPGLIPAGRVVEEQVGLVDLTPTLLDLLEVSPPPEVMGRSFASLLTGGGAKYEERPLAGTAVTESRSIRTRQYKLVTTKMGDLFYDLVKDPLERTSRLAEEPERVAAAREALKATDEACTRWTTAHPAEAAADAAGGNAPAWMINRDEIDRKLRSLGYVQ